MSLRRLLTAVAVLIAIVSGWWLARPLSEVDRHRRQFAELEKQIAAAQGTRANRAADRGRVMRLRAQARAASGDQRASFDAEAAQIEERLGWGDRVTVRTAVASAPLIRISRGTPLSGLVPAASGDGNSCISCHVSIVTPGFERHPSPFRTHPNLALYAGAASPHPPSRVTCVSCHLGDGHGVTFASAGHARLSDEAARPTTSPARRWSDASASTAMLPVGRVEAGCVACHAGERYQPGAASLNDAVTTVERGGCYACHDLPGMERVAKRGPDLRRIAAKVSESWTRAWLANPRAVKPSTWMPRFWRSDALSDQDVAAIDAVVAYLFETSEPWSPARSASGDVRRGQQIVESVGCLGCHVIGDTPRDQVSTRRTFGQPLDALGSKTTEAWLADWVRDPSHYSPETRMPNLRLTAQEGADVAAYLASQRRAVPVLSTPVSNDDRQYRAVLQRYGSAVDRPPEIPAALSGAPLRAVVGRVVIDALGCFNCHEIRGFEGRRRAVPMQARTIWRDADVDAVHSAAAVDAPPVKPDIAPERSERGRLALALTAFAGRTGERHSLSMPWHLAKVNGRSLVAERNCVGCHEIEGTGGDFVQLVAEPTLGPPLLTPEGSRVQPEWLRGFVREPRTIRPWLTARMPTFAVTDDEIGTIGGYLRAIAPPNPKPSNAPPGVTPAAGKELFDLLKCQQCHVLGSIPGDQPTSNLAPDLRLAHERLQPEWIDAWLRNPSAILPGTRMPTFWPDFPKSFYPPLERDAARQVRAIREHVVGLRQ